MQERTFPHTFNSYDKENEKILISPNGPDPVFFGVKVIFKCNIFLFLLQLYL